jgi:hypothetical protein
MMFDVSGIMSLGVGCDLWFDRCGETRAAGILDEGCGFDGLAARGDGPRRSKSVYWERDCAGDSAQHKVMRHGGPEHGYFIA